MFKSTLQKKTLSIVLDGDIYPSYMGGVDASLFRHALSEHDGKFKTIAIDITSNGGDVTVGMAIYTIIKDQVNKGIVVNIRVVGVAASMGSIIALSGTTLEIVHGSWLMIHNPISLTFGDYQEHLNRADMLKTIRDSMANIYTEHSEIEKSEIESMMKAETWISSEKAVSHGFASKIHVNTEITASSGTFDIAKYINSSIFAKNFKNIPTSINTILEPCTNFPEQPQKDEQPVLPEQPKGSAMSKLKDLIASDPEAKLEYDQAIASASSAPVAVVAPVAPVQHVAPVAAISPSVVASSSAYPEHIRKMAVTALVNPNDVTAVATFNVALAMHDVTASATASAQAIVATAKAGETPPAVQNHAVAPVATAQGESPVALITTAEMARAAFTM